MIGYHMRSDKPFGSIAVSARPARAKDVAGLGLWSDRSRPMSAAQPSQGSKRSRLSHAELEEGSDLYLDWSKLVKVAACGEGVVPVCVQDIDTLQVLIVAFANEFALAEALKTNTCVLWSTSRNELWIKGATSGDFLDLLEVRVNCEQNSLLYLVRPRRTGACHTKDASGASRRSCYYRRLLVHAPGEEAEGAGEQPEHADDGNGGKRRAVRATLEHIVASTSARASADDPGEVGGA